MLVDGMTPAQWSKQNQADNSAPPPPPPAPPTKQYTVQPGDGLWIVQKNQLGKDPTPEQYAAFLKRTKELNPNTDVIEEGGRLRYPGVTLTIPANAEDPYAVPPPPPSTPTPDTSSNSDNSDGRPDESSRAYRAHHDDGYKDKGPNGPSLSFQAKDGTVSGSASVGDAQWYGDRADDARRWVKTNLSPEKYEEYERWRDQQIAAGVQGLGDAADQTRRWVKANASPEKLEQYNQQFNDWAGQQVNDGLNTAGKAISDGFNNDPTVKAVKWLVGWWNRP